MKISLNVPMENEMEKEKKHHGISPKDTFLHLLAIITLYASATALLTLCFQFVNEWLPDPAFTDRFINARGIHNAMRFAIASLIVVFPAYIGTSWLLAKDTAIHPEKRNLGIRKWLIYFTLFVGALIIGGDVISVIYNYLQGEFTSRFFLKALSLLLVTGAIFSYYLQDVKKPIPKSRTRVYFWASVVVVGVAVIVGVVVAGSPTEERQYRLDDERLIDLQEIQYSVNSYYTTNGSLPESLDILTSDQSFSVPVDPETRDAYTYRVLDETTFELCAVFSQTNDDNLHAPVVYGEYNSWTHQAGEYCFKRAVSVDGDGTVPAKRIY